MTVNLTIKYESSFWAYTHSLSIEDNHPQLSVSRKMNHDEGNESLRKEGSTKDDSQHCGLPIYYNCHAK